MMTDRRTFMKQTGIAVAALAFAPSCVLGGSDKPLGIQLYSLKDQLPLDPKGVLAKVAKTGYKQVEVYGYENAKFFGLSVQEFKKALDINGLVSPSGHYGMDDFLSGKQNNLDELISVSNQLKHEYLVIPHIGEELRKTADDYKKLAERFNLAGKLCKQGGLKLGYHNHDFEFTNFDGETGYGIFLKNTDPSLVDFEMDLYWVVRAGSDPIALFKQNPHRFRMWHIKDMDKTNHVLNTEIGKGTVDFKKIFDNRELSGVKYYYLEQENYKIDPYKSIKESYNYIETQLL